jgi:hypothetical protein
MVTLSPALRSFHCRSRGFTSAFGGPEHRAGVVDGEDLVVTIAATRPSAALPDFTAT